MVVGSWSLKLYYINFLLFSVYIWLLAILLLYVSVSVDNILQEAYVECRMWFSVYLMEIKTGSHCRTVLMLY